MPITNTLTYLDLYKAFNSVNHWLLLAKLRGYCIFFIVINYVECFFSRRTFQVNANGNISQTVEAISHVPQGSDVSLIPFVIYAKDLPDHVFADSLLYADDVKLRPPSP